MQPFDTIKVRLQTQGHKYDSAMDCMRKTTKGEGYRALFKGMAPPLATAAAVNAIVFATFGYTIRVSGATCVCVVLCLLHAVENGRVLFRVVLRLRVVDMSLLDGGCSVFTQWCKQIIAKDQEGAPTFGQMFMAGACAGVVQVGVLCPTELIKCRLQVLHEALLI